MCTASPRLMNRLAHDKGKGNCKDCYNSDNDAYFPVASISR